MERIKIIERNRTNLKIIKINLNAYKNRRDWV